MGTSSSKRRKQRKSRKVLVILLLCLALALLLHVVPLRLLGGETLQHEIESQLTAAVGMPVQMEGISITFLPVFRVRFHGIHAGTETLHFHADTCDVFMDWRRLARRQVRITTVSIPHMQATVSGEYDAAMSDLNQMVDAVQQQTPQASDKPIQLALESVAVETFQVVVDTREIAVGEVHIKDLMSPEIALAFTAQTSSAANTAHLSAVLQLERRTSQPLLLTGQGAITFSRKLALSQSGKPVQISGVLHSTLTGEGFNDIAFHMTGDAAITSGDDITRGAFDAKAWWQQNAFIVNDLRWQSPGLELLADATIPMAGEAALHLHRAALQPPLTKLALDWVQLPMLKLQASEKAAITITDLLAGMHIDPVPRLVSGTITATGINLTDLHGDPVFPDLQMEAKIVEGQIALKKMVGGGWTITGTLDPDVAAGTIAYGLQASGTVKKEHLQWLSPTLAHHLDSFSGSIDLEEVTGVYMANSRNMILPRCKGRLSECRISLKQNTGLAPIAFPNVEAAFLFEDNTLSLEDVRFGGSLLQGTVHPLPGNDPEALFSGSIQLADVPLSSIMTTLPVSNLKGRLDIAALALTLNENTSTPMRLDGALHNVAASIHTPFFTDQINAFSGTCKMDSHKIRVAATCTSEHLGTLLGEGVYDIRAHQAVGEINLDLGVAAGTLLPETNWRIPAAGIITEAYGQTGLTFSVAMPSETGATSLVELRSQTDPLLYFQGELSGGWHLGERHFQCALPLPVLLKHVNLQRDVSGLAPLPLETEGLVQIRYEQIQAGMPFVLSLDATPCAVRWMPWVYKAPETPARAAIQGIGFQVTTVDLLLDEQSLTLHHNGTGNFQAREVTVPLENVQRLISPDIHLEGEALLSFNTQPLYVQAQLQEIQATLLQEQALGTVNGIVIHDESKTELRGISLRGNGFDCRLDASRNDTLWQASLSGARFDLNRFQDAGELLAKIRGLDSPRETGMTMPNINGTLAMRLEEVAYKRGIIRNIQTTAQLSPEIITAEDLKFRVGNGTIVGRARLQPDQAGARKPVAIYAELAVEGADMAHAEKLIFKQERELTGTATGTVEVQMPTGKEGFRRMDAKFRLRLWNGSLGKLGFATRLTSLLRNQEILSLRMPSLQDEGLTYDEAALRVSMRNGLAQLENCTAGSPSYAIAATGLVDFRQMQTDVQVSLDIFQGVAGLVERLPVIGPTATSVVREATRIRLRATGSPFDIQWQPDILQ